jgi:hypothetical protein
MAKQAALFAAWAAVGLVLSYGLIYAFTPLGLLVITAAVVVATMLPTVRTHRWPEVLGLIAGPGLFCGIIALANHSLAWAFGGAVMLGAALIGWLLAARHRTISP